MAEASSTPASLRCPACRAGQDGRPDTCRRCGADLSLLRAVAERYDETRHRCLRALSEGDPHRALEEARRLVRLAPEPSSRRLHHICALVAGRTRPGPTGPT